MNPIGILQSDIFLMQTAVISALDSYCACLAICPPCRTELQDQPHVQLEVKQPNDYGRKNTCIAKRSITSSISSHSEVLTLIQMS